jgi:hypothetical protein
MRYLLSTLAIILAMPALAELPYSPIFRWSPPTHFVSGAPLDPLVDLSQYRLYCDRFDSTVETMPNVDNEWSAPRGLFGLGEHTCYMTAVGIDDAESAPSNSLTFVIEADAPQPVIIFEVR